MNIYFERVTLKFEYTPTTPQKLNYKDQTFLKLFIKFWVQYCYLIFDINIQHY